MRRHLYTVAASVTALALSHQASAQGAPVSVHGVAFDSLRGQPLKNAIVVVLGVARSTITDARGRFQVDSVEPGTRTFIIQHSFLDSVGFRGLSRRVAITDGQAEVRLAVPSFQTLWRAACGGDPTDNVKFVYGTIREVANREPVANATVELSWVETDYDKRRGVRQRRITGETYSDANGSYVVCGAPMTSWVTVRARVGTANGGAALLPGDLRVQRRDLFVATVDPASRGAISGILTDQDDFGFSEARIVLDDSIETRSGADGRFSFENVLAGTRQIEILSLGMMPIVMSVDVFPRDSATLALQLRRVTTLDIIRVIATSNRARRIAEQLEERRKTGFAYMLDKTELAGYPSLDRALNDLPGARIVNGSGGDFELYVSDGRGGQCIPAVWVDGHHLAVASLVMMKPNDVMAIEFFPRASTIPMEYQRIDPRASCGAVLAWTNWAFGR
ncbi:MAG: carboxypeptidase regulatory-like domain-containing protein [Gemmatimonadaceae bacterium]